MLHASRVSAKVRQREGHSKSILLSGRSGVEEVNIFLTLQNSDWFRNMSRQAENNVGYENESWTTRAMVALGPAGIEGKSLTINEIELELAPFVGHAGSRHSMNNMMRRACRRGIISRTGRKRYVEGTSNPYPEYMIHGHLEIDNDGAFRSVGVCAKPDGRHDAV